MNTTNTRTLAALAVLCAAAVAGCSSSSDGGSPVPSAPSTPDGTGTPGTPGMPDTSETPDVAPGPDPVDGTPESVERRYEVEVINLTGGQTLSEPALILHPAADTFWEIGQPASEALERLAESGESDGLSDLAVGGSYAFAGGEAAVPPGTARTVTITTRSDADDSLTLLTRLESTDDGFTGVNAVDLAGLAEIGQSMTLDRWALDSGTDKNLESTNLGSFGAARPSEPSEIAGSEFAFVTVHPGVVTEIESTPDNTSQLNRSRKFDNPVVRIRVTRVGP